MLRCFHLGGETVSYDSGLAKRVLPQVYQVNMCGHEVSAVNDMELKVRYKHCNSTINAHWVGSSP